jgi:hypothetical protein
MINPESQSEEIDKLIAEIEDLNMEEGEFSEIDALCSEIDQALQTKKREVANWPLERKRNFAANGTDPYVLGLLAMDENFNVRTLAFCNPNVPVNLMRWVLDKASDYLRVVIANNPNCPSDVLDRLVELTNEPSVLDAVKVHPNVSEITKYKIENRMT